MSKAHRRAGERFGPLADWRGGAAALVFAGRLAGNVGGEHLSHALTLRACRRLAADPDATPGDRATAALFHAFRVYGRRGPLAVRRLLQRPGVAAAFASGADDETRADLLCLRAQHRCGVPRHRRRRNLLAGGSRPRADPSLDLARARGFARRRRPLPRSPRRRPRIPAAAPVVPPRRPASRAGPDPAGPGRRGRRPARRGDRRAAGAAGKRCRRRRNWRRSTANSSDRQTPCARWTVSRRGVRCWSCRAANGSPRGGGKRACCSTTCQRRQRRRNRWPRAASSTQRPPNACATPNGRTPGA